MLIHTNQRFKRATEQTKTMNENKLQKRIEHVFIMPTNTL